jgi:NAD-dependent dihydropyrimidine dehydrogenase PreA subunit
MEKHFLQPPLIRINFNSYSKCDLCSKICPTRIFKATNGDDKIIAHPEECVLCGQCICGCPTNSIFHSGFTLQNFKLIRNKKPVIPETAFEFLS